MSAYRRGPSLTAAAVAVYVAGSLSSFGWDLLGAAFVGSGEYLDARPSALAVLAWRIGGVVATSVLAAIVVKVILDLEEEGGVSFARSFSALFVGNLAGTLAFLALPLAGQEAVSDGNGGGLVLMAIMLHWLGFVLSVLILLGASPIAAEEGREWGEKLPPGTRWREDANLLTWIDDADAEDDASSRSA
jgi:hypothetical protein